MVKRYEQIILYYSKKKKKYRVLLHYWSETKFNLTIQILFFIVRHIRSIQIEISFLLIGCSDAIKPPKSDFNSSDHPGYKCYRKHFFRISVLYHQKFDFQLTNKSIGHGRSCADFTTMSNLFAEMLSLQYIGWPWSGGIFGINSDLMEE